jgi:hypothetical protein
MSDQLSHNKLAHYQQGERVKGPNWLCHCMAPDWKTWDAMGSLSRRRQYGPDDCSCSTMPAACAFPT